MVVDVYFVLVVLGFMIVFDVMVVAVELVGDWVMGVWLIDGTRLGAGEVLVAVGVIYFSCLLAVLGVCCVVFGYCLKDYVVVVFFVELVGGVGLVVFLG